MARSSGCNKAGYRVATNRRCQNNCPASLHSNNHFRLLRQPVKQLVARKFDLSCCGFAMSIDTEKIKVRFSQIYTGDFLFRQSLFRILCKCLFSEVTVQ
ncbi:hypothetical protein Q0S20_24800, partial [Escherichia coli O2:H6]